jgi:IclR family pca regulon transcriptional regulator
MARKRLHFVRSLARGLAVLQAFSAERPLMTLTELARATGMNLPATQRFTDTLVQLGYLKRDEHKRYYLGPKVVSLGLSFLDGSQLRKLAARQLHDFGRRHDKTVNLAVLDGHHIIFLYRHESQRFLKFDLQPGSKLPAHCTAQGKVLLAALPDSELRQRLEEMPLERFTSHTLTTPQAVWDDLMQTRQRGYAIADRELSLDLYSLGAPLLDARGRVIAAINLSLRAEETSPAYRDQMTRAFLDLGAEVSASLGYQGQYPRIPVAEAEEGLP